MRYDDEDRESWTRPAVMVGAAGAVLAMLLGMFAPHGAAVWQMSAPEARGTAAQWEDLIDLIPTLSIWLLFAGAFAAMAGWAFGSGRRAPAERALRRERDGLLRDLVGMALGESGAANDEAERIRAEDALRGQLSVRDARIAELEQALERARESSNSAASELAELHRRLERADADARELERLRAMDVAREQQQLIDAQVGEPEPDRDAALQAWRLRYFEQRVRYLEGLARPQPAAMAPVVEHPQPERAQPPELFAADWRAREAEARAAFLADEVRAASAAPTSAVESETPFAANADVDMLLRWRLLYLERRVAHLQAAQREKPESVTPEAALQPVSDAAPDSDRWKWRARYLEARVRHLEQRPAAPVAPAAQGPVELTAAEEDFAEPSAPPPSDRPRRKPPVLSSPRDGAPDDLTLIEGVSALQQSTLYSIGVFHFDQIAAWTPEHVAWVDNYLRLRGRIDEEDWVEQADALARELAGA
jgi:predicted flap endonuclease-1-like 5' DNA nuclease